MNTETLRDRLWLWGMKVNILQETGELPWGTSRMTTEDAIQKTGITNILMAGGLEIDRETLDSMPSARRIICKWGLHRHVKGSGHVVDYERCWTRLRGAKELAAADTRIDAFLVDDFSTGTVDAGVTPSDLARLQFANATFFPHLPLMATMYTMSLDRPELPSLLPYFASFLTPLWHAADIDVFPKGVEKLSKMSGGKPQLLCIYLYDFGNGKVMSYELMRRQMDVVENLLREGKAFGAVILGTCMMDLDWDSNRCFIDWLAEKGTSPV